MLPDVIRLRTALERGLRNPWLRPILIVAFALALGFLVFHSAGDNNQIAVHDAPLLVCLALAFLLGILLGATAPPEVEEIRRRSPRAPPYAGTPRIAAGSHNTLASPLRL
jgi:hypothetical protein